MKIILHAFFYAFLFCPATLAQEAKNLKIIEKPVPQLSQAQKESNMCLQGTVALRVEFLAGGQIGNVLPISDLPYGLTENAAEAAKKIKFEPAVEQGVPITVSKVVQYNFARDGGWNNSPKQPENHAESNSVIDEKADAVLKKAIAQLGGERYLGIKSQLGRGRFSVMRDGLIVSFQTFVDVIVFPDKERTEFKRGGAKTVQVNTGDAGWIFDGDAEMVKEQSEDQIANFKRGIRVSLDNLLRGNWRGDAALTYIGKRQGTLGKRNDVVKLTYADDFAIEFEFTDEGLPVKAIYKRTNADGEEVKEEDRYAQFIEVQGIKTPFIIDRFTNGVQNSRINYESVEYNKSFSDSIFAKPKTAKEAKKDVKL